MPLDLATNNDIFDWKFKDSIAARWLKLNCAFATSFDCSKLSEKLLIKATSCLNT